MAEAPAHPEDELAGRVLDGRYAIEGKLGEGGLGVVHRAMQTRLGRHVAVKVLHAEHAKKPTLRERFEREAKSLARLQHPNIVDVIDYGIDGDSPFLVMELLEGRPLDAAIRAGLAPEEGLAIAREVIAAVAYAHARGIVHRDLKPANVFLQRMPGGGEIPRVLDFGLAKLLGETTESDAPLTKAGSILGTPAYMSPEQATGAASDVRADVYSLGIVLFELVTGTRPFVGPAAELLRMHLLADMPSLASARPGLRDVLELDAIVRRATAKSASKRYADAGELLDALAPFVPERTSRTSRASREAAPTRVAPAVASPDADATVARSPAPATRDAVPRAPVARPDAPPEPTELVRSRTEDGAAPVPGKRTAVIAAAGLAGVVIAAYVAVQLFGGDAEAPGATPTPAAPTATPELAAQAAPTAPDPAEALPPDPVAAQAEPAPTAARAAAAAAAVARVRESRGPASPDRYALPPELAAIRRRYAPGARLSDGDRRLLFQYADAHRGDPRAWLVMAHVDFGYGARSDALRFYGYALREDREAKADPTMLRDVAIMAGHRAVGRRAADMLADVWGSDAVPAIDAVLREVELDADSRRRLVETRESLRALEGT